MTASGIRVEGLGKTFPVRAVALPGSLFGMRSRGSVEVLRDVTLDVRPGEILGLLGANGAGKTTLLEILTTILLPTMGRAWVCGYDVVRQPSRVRGVLGYCPCDSRTFYPRITGRQNLEFFGLLNDLPARSVSQRVGRVLDLVELDGARDRRVECYSEGTKQRLSLARALLTDPAVLILDEPTRSLDPLLQGEIRRFLRKTVVEAMAKTVVLVTHSLAEAEEICDRLAILHEGRIVGVGTPTGLKEAFGEPDLPGVFRRATGGAL